MNNYKRLNSAFLIILVAIIPFIANAQKLPNVQQNNLRAPDNIKIDARLNEWGDTFKAYNNTTNVFYTMANDDKNLYLVIKSADQMNNNKIMAGGINFTVNTAGKKNEKGAYTIVFPLIDMAAFRGQTRQVTVMRAPGGGDNIRFDMGPGGGAPTQPDSAAIAARRKKAISTVKEIKLLGFTADIPDTVISIFNEYSIKAALDYDAKGSLVYEMAIPLKYLHLSTDNSGEFAYNIKLNGLNLSAMMPPGAVMIGPGGGGDGGGMRGGGDMIMGGGGPPPGPMQAMISPTDFWGKYTLAKK
jgi:hypothetical protein